MRLKVDRGKGEGMKTLLITCLLLVAGPVHADDSAFVTSVGALSPIDDFQYTEQGYLMVTKESVDKLLRDYPDAKLRLQIADHPCLARMEEAMRKMEPYLGEDLTMFWRAPAEGLLHDEKMRVKAQWDMVAKECWSKP